MADNTSHLPLEIIETILSRLPSKSLLRFKTVSKSWNILISDPIFVRRQSKDSNKLQNLFLLENSRVYSEGFSLVKVETGGELEYLQVIKGPFLFGNRVLCFCEGLSLITDASKRNLALWNPSTRTHTELLPPFNCSRATFGLCRDPITDDFKVVVVDWDRYSVYSCKNKSWTILEKKYEIRHSGFGLTHDAGVCVDGASYWFRWITRQIVYYDPRDDKFKILHSPEKFIGNESIYLVDLSGSLCLYCEGRERNTIVIWTKGKGIDNHSWKELMTIRSLGTPIRSFGPQCLVENEIVIRIRGRRIHDKLVVYNPCKNRFREIKDTKLFFDHVLVPYIDSLFFPIEISRT